MFKEELRSDDKLPVSIRIVSLENYPLHYHPDVELIFVLQGRIRLLLGCNDYLLEEGSVFVCNGNEVHSMVRTDHSNTVALIQVNNNIFSKYYPNLSRSCYRTNTPNPNDERLMFLRRELTDLLLVYTARPHDHQQTSVAIVKKLLSYLEANFNYFSVRNKIVLNEPLDSFTLTKRMSRVILNIYESHYRKLPIGELSKKENLSSYYLSHCIRKYIGLSYRELLSFARVESSQVLLLNQAVDLKDIYEMVGFSASHYFDQHFFCWFKQTPFEYRKTFIEKIKTQANQEILKEISGEEFINCLESCANDGLQALWNHQNSKQSGLNVSIDTLSGKTVDFMPEICVGIPLACAADIDLMDKLEKINPDKRITAEIKRHSPKYGWDTIAGAVFVLRNMADNKVSLSLKDPHSGSTLFQGYPALLFSNGIPKCSYYAFLFFSKARGKLIDRGINYWVIQKDHKKNPSSYIIMVFNGSEATDSICTLPSPLKKTSEIISAFNEELNIKFSLNGLTGAFKIGTISVDSTTDYFYYLNSYGKRTADEDVEQLMAEQYTAPYVNIYNADAVGSLEINVRLDGLGIHFITISPLVL